MRNLLWLIVILSLYASSEACAIQRTILVVMSSMDEPYCQTLEGVVEQLEEQDTECRILRYSHNLLKRQKQLFLRVIEKKNVDLVLTIGTPATLGLMEIDMKAPVVFSSILNPFESGIIGKNSPRKFTGACLDIQIEDQFRYLKLIVPELKKIGVLYSEQETGPLIRKAQKVARKLNLGLIAEQVQSGSDVTAKLEKLSKKVDALWSVADSVVFGESIDRIIEYTIEKKLSFMGLSSSFVKRGALFAIEPDYKDVGRQTAEIIEQIFAGKSPDEIRPAYPRTCRLALNENVARTLGFIFPEEAQFKVTGFKAIKPIAIVRY